MSKIWRYSIDRDLVFTTRYNVGKFENEWLKLDGHKITIFGSHMRGYSWDGCTPTVEFLDLYFGTPSGVVRRERFYEVLSGGKHKAIYKYVPKTYTASLIHDILYQFKEDVPIPRKMADLIFLEKLEEQNFMLAGLYYFGVRIFGDLQKKWKVKDCL